LGWRSQRGVFPCLPHCLATQRAEAEAAARVQAAEGDVRRMERAVAGWQKVGGGRERGREGARGGGRGCYTRSFPFFHGSVHGVCPSPPSCIQTSTVVTVCWKGAGKPLVDCCQSPLAYKDDFPPSPSLLPSPPSLPPSPSLPPLRRPAKRPWSARRWWSKPASSSPSTTTRPPALRLACARWCACSRRRRRPISPR